MGQRVLPRQILVQIGGKRGRKSRAKIGKNFQIRLNERTMSIKGRFSLHRLIIVISLKSLGRRLLCEGNGGWSGGKAALMVDGLEGNVCG